MDIFDSLGIVMLILLVIAVVFQDTQLEQVKEQKEPIMQMCAFPP